MSETAFKFELLNQPLKFISWDVEKFNFSFSENNAFTFPTKDKKADEKQVRIQASEEFAKKFSTVSLKYDNQSKSIITISVSSILKNKLNKQKTSTSKHFNLASNIFHKINDYFYEINKLKIQFIFIKLNEIKIKFSINLFP